MGAAGVRDFKLMFPAQFSEGILAWRVVYIGTYATYQVDTYCFRKAYCIYGDTHFFVFFFLLVFFFLFFFKRDKSVVCVQFE